ncbi:acetoin utilization protein AcuC [Lacibacterium aquatile]|uniref:Acetoin utilization protein AcuC n=1 Tax=Lacibacterium aquatile TaxID=1168082 RepID=A0ABW5DN18_9PROT
MSIPRVSSTLDLVRALGWLPEEQYRDSPMATPAELARFHDPAYIAALLAAERDQRVSPEDRARFNIGCNGNPIFTEMYRRPVTAAGAGLLAADLVASGQALRVQSPAGGTHHGRAGQANGFCFVNDPVLTILRLLDRGVPKVFYLDLDAHHGDGVELAFAGSERVLCLSIHETNRWPYTGLLEDTAGGSAINLPVPEGFHDAELIYLMDRLVLSIGREFAAPVIVIQCGADALADDPQSRLNLTNRGLWAAVKRALTLAPQAIVLGGGGYNPWSVARAWAGLWGLINNIDESAPISTAAEAVLRGLSWDHRLGRNPPDHWLTTLADPPAEPLPVRQQIMDLAGAAMGLRASAA